MVRTSAVEADYQERLHLTQYPIGADFEKRVRFADTYPATVVPLQVPTSRAHQGRGI